MEARPLNKVHVTNIQLHVARIQIQRMSMSDICAMTETVMVCLSPVFSVSNTGILRKRSLHQRESNLCNCM